MSRYNRTRLNKKNKTILHYNSLQQVNSDQYFMKNVEGDRCDNLAFRFYGDTSLWWFMHKVNGLTTNNIFLTEHL